jgi:hypothetical protein
MKFLSSIGNYMKKGRTLAAAIGAIVAALIAAADYWDKTFPENSNSNETNNP